MKVRFLKVVAIDTYDKSINYGKQVEFIVEDNCTGRQRISLYSNPKITEIIEEDFID